MRGGWLLGWTSWLALGCAEPASLRSAEGERQVALLHTADLHSRVWPYQERIAPFEAELGLGPAGSLQELGGFARLASVVEQERRRGAELWLDSGDVLEGAEVFERFGGRLELELLSRLGLSALALGNHELSLSSQSLADVLSRATFPVLAANLRAEPGSALAGRLAPSVLLRAGELRVGVIGVANPTSPPGLSRPGNAWALELLAEPARAVQAALDDVAPRADLLIVLSHLGIDGDRGLVAATSGIDLVLGGHQHVVTAEPEWADDRSARRVPIVHSGSYGKLVSRLELRLQRSPEPRAGWELVELGLERRPLASGAPERQDVLELLEPLRAPQLPVAWAPALVARRSALGGDSALGNLTADAVQAASGADVVLLNSSALRADLEPGLLVRSDLVLALPFEEPWLRVWAAGRELRRGLERAGRRSAARRCESTLQVAGLRLRIDCAACSRGTDCVDVVRVTPWGELPLRDDELLAISLPAYLAQPGADFAEFAAGSTPARAPTVVAALTDYVARSAPVVDAHECVAALRELTPRRCQDAFGAASCPLTAVQARASCRQLPQIEGARDGRIRLQP